jgi:Phage tail tube protein
MAGQKRVGGLIALKIDGNQYNAKGNFTYNLGRPKREGVLGAEAVHGYKETPQVAFLEGEITDNDGLDLDTLLMATDVVVHLQLGTGKVIVFNHAWFAGEGTGNTEEGNIGVRFEAERAEEFA